MQLLDKIKFILKIWTKLANHVRMRDRSIKILQYGSQMLLGFYASQLSSKMVESLSLTRRTASTSRKAFWLMKSINHVHSIVDMIEAYDWSLDEGYANLLDILEQFALVVYYWYETLVFFTRVKLVSFTEDSIDGWGNMSWFLEDFVCLMACIIRTFLHVRKMCEMQLNVSRANPTSTDAAVGNCYIKYESNSESNNSLTERCNKKNHEELSRMNVRLFDLLLGVTIVRASSTLLHFTK